MILSKLLLLLLLLLLPLLREKIKIGLFWKKRRSLLE
jgi:hypothetical protein